MSSQLQIRSKIDSQFKWNLKDIFPDDQRWEEHFKSLKNDLPELAAFQRKLSESAKVLLQFIRQMHDAEEMLGKLYAYAHMKNDQDKSVATYQEMYERSSSLLVEYNQSVSFFEPEILQLAGKQIIHVILRAEEELWLIKISHT